MFRVFISSIWFFSGFDLDGHVLPNLPSWVGSLFEYA